MIARIQIPDNLEIGKIYKGSIYLTANGEGSFRKYNISDKKAQKKAFKKLSHGRISWNDDDINVRIHIDRKETGVKPCDVIERDFDDAFSACEDLDKE